MLSRLAKWVTTHPKKIIALWLILLIASAGFAMKLADVLSVGGFNDPHSESIHAQKILENNFDNKYTQNLIVVLKNQTASVKSDQFKNYATTVKNEILKNKKVEHVETYYDNKNDTLISKDGHVTFMIVGMNTTEDQAASFVPVLNQQLSKITKNKSPFQLWVTGGPALSYGLNDATKKAVTSAEMIAFPAMIIILLLVFRSVVSAFLPLLMSGFALSGTMAIAYFVAKQTTLNVLLTNAVSMIGLGVIVDYALFIISRFRKELDSGAEPKSAVIRSVSTAGRAVFFSGATVAVSLSSLFLPRIMIFDSIAIGGVIVVTMAVLVALTLLPAILVLLGHRINMLRLPIFSKSTSQSKWMALAKGITKRPVLFVIPALILLSVLSYPSIKLQMQVPVASASILPKDDVSRIGFNVLASEFGQGDVFPIKIVLQSKDGSILTKQKLTQIQTITQKISRNDAVDKVISLTNWNSAWNLSAYVQAYQHLDALPTNAKNSLSQIVNLDQKKNTTVLLVSSKYPADSKPSHNLVKQIRNTLNNMNLISFHYAVGGQTAIGLDFDKKIFKSLPIIIISVFLVSYFILFLSFRSILLPLKALILNSLVTLSSMGMLVVFFQEGIALNNGGTINSITPVVLFAVLFGLSMDYEVLIISRIRELTVDGRDNESGIIEGISQTAGLVNGAAAIMIAVFGAFALVQVEIVKELGFGLAIAILLDATVVRTILVPSIMKLLGRMNWWIPFQQTGRSKVLNSMKEN